MLILPILRDPFVATANKYTNDDEKFALIKFRFGAAPEMLASRSKSTVYEGE